MSLTIESSFLWNETVWNPSMIQTALWLDAADASTVTTVSGAVSQWNDKSGNGRNAAQSDAASRPTYATAAQNSRNALTFDNSNDKLTIAQSELFASGNADLAIFAAYKAKEPSSGYGSLFGNYPGNNFMLYFGGLAPYLEPWGVFNLVNVDISTDAYVQNKNYLIGLIRSSGSFTGWTDGSQNNTAANTASVYSGANTSSVWNIGSNSSGGEVAGMDLYELICVNSAPSAANRQKLEGYLAHKWGLTANLPAGHPYKNYGPKP